MTIIGIGTDITEIARIQKMLEKHGDHFLRHVFTEGELRYSSSKTQQGQHLAGRWAAKEAVLKALGTGWIGNISWKDVEVQNELSGKPTIRLFGGAKEVADRLGITEIFISISHCECHATAFAIATSHEILYHEPNAG